MPTETESRDDGMRQYVLEETIEYYQEGQLTRRDALKQLAAITGSFILANSLLAACAPPPTVAPTSAPVATTAPTVAPTNAPAATSAPNATTAPTQPVASTSPTTASGSLSISANDPALEASMVQFPNQGATILGYLAKPKGNGPFALVLVCHENRGLTEHIKDVARRAAKAGYVVLAVDLLSRQGGTDKVDASQVPGALSNASPVQQVSDFQAALDYFKSQPYAVKDRVGMVGFCFGGGITWRGATGIPELRAAVPFYGPNPPLEDVAKIKAAVLGIYGALDTRINAGIPAIEDAMKKANKTFDKIIYPNANHAFNNDTGASYNADAARDAWAKTLAWFEKYLKG